MNGDKSFVVIQGPQALSPFFLFLGSFLNSCGCSMAKSKTPPHEIFFQLNGTEHGSQVPNHP